MQTPANREPVTQPVRVPHAYETPVVQRNNSEKLSHALLASQAVLDGAKKKILSLGFVGTLTTNLGIAGAGMIVAGFLADSPTTASEVGKYAGIALVVISEVLTLAHNYLGQNMAEKIEERTEKNSGISEEINNKL